MECAKMLDNFRIPPCGHWVREYGVLIKVYASCQPHQQAVEPCFSVEGIELLDDTLAFWKNKKVNEAVKFDGFDFTKLDCGRGPNEPCAFEPRFELQSQS